MAKIIRQSVVLAASPAALYDMYLYRNRHSAIIDAKVSIGRKPGAPFSAWDGSITGRVLQLVPKRLIVQTWRAEDWRKNDVDSTLILSFHADPRGGRIDLVQVNVPNRHAASISDGWRSFYWKPWREYLKRS